MANNDSPQFFYVQVLLKIQSRLHRYILVLLIFVVSLEKCSHNIYCYQRLSFFCLMQWMLQIPGATSYIGCIGKDKFGEEMKKNSKAAGVKVSPLSKPFSPNL